MAWSVSGFLRVLAADELLDLVLDAARGDVVAVGGGKSRREEVLERQHATRRLHELLVRHAADRGLVHAHGFGDFTQRERLEACTPRSKKSRCRSTM